MSSTTYCIECKKPIGATASKCPHCGSSFPTGITLHLNIIGATCFFAAYCIYPNLSKTFFSFIAGGALCWFFAKKNHEGVQRIQERAAAEYFTSDEDNDNDEYYSGRSSNYNPPPVEYYWENPGRVPVNTSLAIEYSSASGEQTSREIDISNYDGTAYLRGYCNLREEPRTFRIDRIKSCVDTVTGEIVEDVPTHLLNKYKKSAQYLFENKQYVREIIRVLYYIGKSDSQLRKEERAIIYKVFRQITKQPNFSDEEIAKVINNIAPLSPQAFKLAVGKIAKIKIELLKYTYKAAKRIVGTQKTVHPNEQEALDFMAKKITESTKQEAPLSN